MRFRVESEMKKGKSGRIVFSGYLDTDGARTGGQAGRAREGGHSRPPERRSTREEGNHYWRRCCFDNTFCKGRESLRPTDRPTDRLNDGRTDGRHSLCGDGGGRNNMEKMKEDIALR